MSSLMYYKEDLSSLVTPEEFTDDDFVNYVTAIDIFLYLHVFLPVSHWYIRLGIVL